MTYAKGANETKALKVAYIRWSGTASLNTYMTFTVDQELPSSFITSLTQTNTEINLPVGHYFAQAYIDYTRSSTNDNNQFGWFVDGTLSGHYGSSDYYHANTCDVAETAFTLESAGALRLKITGVNGSAASLNDPHCVAIIWRTDK
jgi:hypothetical protein|tara:strand:+ start:239 stop:676 length:438 start_codon:yes stop_codon:yes gene_type:complete